MTDYPNDDFHEVWWIYAPERHTWGGLRVAHFRKTIDGALIVGILGESDPRRIGLRIWADIAPREGWVMVKQIMLPSRGEVDAALDTALRDIAEQITRDVSEAKEDKHARDNSEHLT